MDSYGAQLKKAREAKGLDFEIIARETSIKREFLEALEKEDSAVFPGSPYLIGFLHNYAEYLGVDSDAVISLYHAKEIQEAPVPTGLIVKQKPSYFVPLVVAGCVATALILFFTIFFVVRHNEKVANRNVAVGKNAVSHQYELTEKPFNGRLYKSDQIILNTKNGKVILTVANTLKSLSIETPVGMQYINLSEELELDVDGDSQPELIVYVSDISSTDESRGAEVRLMLKAGGEAVAKVDADLIPEIAEIPENTNRFVILEDTRAYPFTINASFRAGCLFRYRCDRKDVVEDYLASGDTVTMTASNAVRVWISNGNTVKLQVVADSKSYDLEVSKAGQVVAEDIKWIKDTDGKYKLVVFELD